jgi:hypothetical protein
LNRLSSCSGSIAHRIHADADRETGRLADRVSTRSSLVLRWIDQIRQPDRVDVEHRGGVRIRAHLRRIAGDDEQVARPTADAPNRSLEHAEQVAIRQA